MYATAAAICNTRQFQGWRKYTAESPTWHQNCNKTTPVWRIFCSLPRTVCLCPQCSRTALPPGNTPAPCRFLCRFREPGKRMKTGKKKPWGKTWSSLQMFWWQSTFIAAISNLKQETQELVSSLSEKSTLSLANPLPAASCPWSWWPPLPQSANGLRASPEKNIYPRHLECDASCKAKQRLREGFTEKTK